jgi:hypothetical protein
MNISTKVLKGEAHDWFCNNSDDFKFVCFQAEIEPKYVRMKYLEALERKDIFFTKRQNLNILYTKEYEKLRKAKTREQRRKHTRIINQLRQAIFECSD